MRMYLNMKYAALVLTVTGLIAHVTADYNTAYNALTVSCQTQISTCLLRSTVVSSLYTELKYCDAIKYSSASFTSQTCLLEADGCSSNEYTSLTDAVCGASSLIVGTVTIVFSFLLYALYGL